MLADWFKIMFLLTIRLRARDFYELIVDEDQLSPPRDARAAGLCPPAMT